MLLQTTFGRLRFFCWGEREREKESQIEEVARQLLRGTVGLDKHMKTVVLTQMTKIYSTCLYLFQDHTESFMIAYSF
jgi:hypothetical protein